MQMRMDNGFRVSPQQKHLFLLQKFNNSNAYYVKAAIKIEGNMNPEILKAAIENLVNRNEILRTNFDEVPGMTIPLQFINESSMLSFHDYDLSGFAPQEQQAKIDALFHKESLNSFDLGEGALLHISLIKMSSCEHVLLISLPSLCADMTTLNNLVHEISRSYAACLHGKELSDESMQYADISEWLNELLESEDTEAGREYWRQQDISSIFTLKVPFENQSSRKAQFEPQSLTLTISPDTLAKIETLVKKCDTSVSVFLLACWHVVLWRLTGQSNIFVGTACDGRKYQELKEVLGLLAKYLPTHSNLKDNLRFTELLVTINESSHDVHKWQEYFNWEQIAAKNGNFAEPPFFPFSFDFEEQPTRYTAADISFLIYKQYACIDRFKVKLSVVHRNDFLLLEFHYDSSLFQVDNIRILSEQYCTLLDSVINNPEAAIRDLEILSDIERQRLLIEFNDTKTDYPLDKCIHQLFEEQVLATPNNIAVVFEDQQLTYAQLNARANQLAHHLVELGVGPEKIVGLCLERSVETFIGLLGILKAGGAYLPLDPILPTQRLAFMLQDAQVCVILTEQHLAGRLSQQAAPLVCLDSDWDAIAQGARALRFAQQPDENLPSAATAENLVYVIYTSGSTGQPKGVAIEHRQLLNYLHGILQRLDLRVGSSFATLSTFAADLGNTIIFSSLCTGGCLHVISQERATNPQALADYQQRHPIDCFKIVPSHLRALLAAADPEKILPTACLIVGGEALSWQLVEQLRQLAPGCQILNHYGPTEATVGVLTYAVQGQKTGESSQTLPLGRPLANTQIYLLDEHNQPLPMGVPGELHIGGACLARGYLNRPELTTQQFIPNHLSDSPSARLYKTGDLARYLPNGNIEFLGRIDHQVKIRGFRIELAEIEAVLNQHPQVLHSAVLVREDVPGEQRLVAYLVAKQQSAPKISDLRHFLKQQLPEYMVPSAFVMLDALPLTANGKVDRSHLRTLELRPEEGITFVAPRTPIQQILAGIWSEVLGVEEVGVWDNFFERGGHSLLATQLISRLRTTLAVELPLRSLFEHPTVSGLAQYVETALRRGSSIVAPPLLPIARDGKMPLSHAQARLWFLDQLEPGNTFYNIPAAVRLSGRLNVAALQQSLNQIISRHEVLRTNFATLDGQPVQVIAETFTLTLPVVNLQQLSATSREIESQRLAKQEAVRPFDLAAEPLVRAKLLKLSEAEHILLLTMHHIISDGWSIGVLVREFAALYEAFCNDLPLELPKLPIQYADFAVWQRQWLQGEVRSSQLAYWQQQLDGATALLELPTDRPRSTAQTFRGARQTFALSGEVSQALMSLSQQQGVTLFMTLLAAFQTLLYRYTGQDDICTGTPIANRNCAEIEGLIGFFVNTLVLRTDLSGNPSFKEVLSRVREVALGAYAHQDLPFEQLVEALQPERSLSHTPLFQVMFVLQNAPMPSLELEGLRLSPMAGESATAKYDLLLSVEETSQGLIGSWEYNTDLFDATTIARMAGCFQTLLQGIVTNPHQRLSDLPILSATEQQQLLVEWNDTKADYPQDVYIHQLFEAQVEQTPGAVAVVFDMQQLTYRELNNRANKLAHHLQALGVGPEVLVGICVERSLEMLVGLLGILKAGGAYLPLDPAYPKERLAFMLKDAQVPVLLTQQRLIEGLPEHGAKVVCLDNDWKLLAQQSEENPVSEVTSENLAYVIYTSGSTGRPKGTLIPHRGLVNYLAWCIRAYAVEDGEGAPIHSSISFDMTITGLFSPLLVGRRVELLSETMGVDSLEIALRNGSNFSLVKITPAQLDMLRHQLSPQEVAGRTRAFIIGGENLVAQSIAFWQDFAPDTILVNEYGPTETVVGCCIYQVPNGKHQSGSIPIGRPIANTQLYILDRYLQPVPIGVPGELYISSDGLARGYLNRREVTAERFIPNPFGDELGARLYKTGDLARYLPDGNIEYLGRIDHQVKIRGFRLELGEIEEVLNQHPEVRQSAVIAREDVPGDKRLVAYLVPKQQPAPTISDLHRFLKQQLPEYMVPSAFVMLDTLPLTVNGKVDRRALPAPQMARPELERTFVAPRTPIEQMLAKIWADVLRVEQVGIHDNFFELGGDSILVIQIIARAKQAGLQLTPRQLFEHKTIAELAAVAGATQALQVEQGVVTGRLPLTPIQHWFFHQNLPYPAHWNQAVLLEVQPDINPGILERVVQYLLVHHDTLRLRFESSDLGWQQLVAAPDDTIPFTCFDLSALPEAEQKPAIEATAAQLQASLNLEEGPLMQVAFFALGIYKHNRLLIVIHHLAVDGVSWRILLEDLQTGYQQLSQGKTIVLPPKTTAFKHWAQRLTEHASSGALESELAYWQRQAGRQVSPIPTDLVGGANTEASGRTVSVSLNVEETNALLQEVPKAYNTQINDVLLTALLQVYCHWSGSNSLLLDLEGHGREDIFEDVDLSRTVGWFTTIFPVLLEMGTTDNLGDVLKSVKEQLRGIPNKGMGYGLLRYLSGDEEIASSLNGLSPAPVSFNYLGQFDQVLDASSLFQPATESSGASRNLQGSRSHLLDINGLIVGGQLRIDWIYSKSVHRHTTIERLAQHFVEALRALIAHCLSPEIGGYTPSDFPLAELSSDELERALASLEF